MASEIARTSATTERVFATINGFRGRRLWVGARRAIRRIRYDRTRAVTGKMGRRRRTLRVANENTARFGSSFAFHCLSD